MRVRARIYARARAHLCARCMPGACVVVFVVLVVVIVVVIAFVVSIAALTVPVQTCPEPVHIRS